MFNIVSDLKRLVGSYCQFSKRAEAVSRQTSKTAFIPRIMDFRGSYKGGGGPDKTVLNSAAQHDPDKVYVLVVYLRQPADDGFQIPEMARRLGINYQDVPDGSMIDRACLAQLKQIVKEHDLQIVHAHDEKTLLYAWLLTFMVPGLKIMHTCHSYAVYGRKHFRAVTHYLSFRLRQKILTFLMGRHLKPIITVSGDTRARLMAAGIADKDVTVLRNGIDLSVWQSNRANPVLREELGIKPGGLLVGTVARITSEKDLPTFYRVAEMVAAIIPGVTFVIVGDGYGDRLENAREEVARRGISGLVHFTGHRADLIDIYASFDVFLMTSETEGLPNTLLEAMAMGIPVVSTEVGGVPELLEAGKSGFLAPIGDAEGLSGLVISLLKDALLREMCAASSRKRVEEHFSFERRVRAMEEYYSWFAGMDSLPSQQEITDQEEHAHFRNP